MIRGIAGIAGMGRDPALSTKMDETAILSLKISMRGDQNWVQAPPALRGAQKLGPKSRFFSEN